MRHTGKRTSLALLAGGVVLLLVHASSGIGIGENKSLEGQSFSQPVRLSLVSSGNLIVSDFTRRKVFTLDRNSLKITNFVSIADVNNDFGEINEKKEGRPMAVGQFGNLLFVGNAFSSRVEVRDANKPKKILYNLGDKTGNPHIKKPTDLAVDKATGQVFVLDGAAKMVSVFRSDGALLYSIPIPSNPNDPNKMTNLTSIALDEANQEVLVSDHGPLVGFSFGGLPGYVHIFSYTGEFRGQIQGNLSGFRFSRPQGLAVDSGKIFIVDSVLGQVLVFDRTTLAGIATIGKFGTNPGELFAPTDIVVDKGTKDVFVVSANPARVEVYRNGGLFP